jgi:uncharacterized protein (DUF2062 family)
MEVASERAGQLKESFWKRRVVGPILGQLRAGITPEKVALTIALGVVVGIFPILGSTTLLCTGTAFALRLNQPIIQLVNYFVYPLQIALLLVFYRAGESLFGQPHAMLSIAILLERFKSGAWQFLKDFGMIGLQGIAVWMLIAAPLAALLYLGLRAPLRALSRRVS